MAEETQVTKQTTTEKVTSKIITSSNYQMEVQPSGFERRDYQSLSFVYGGGQQQQYTQYLINYGGHAHNHHHCAPPQTNNIVPYVMPMPIQMPVPMPMPIMPMVTHCCGGNQQQDNSEELEMLRRRIRELEAREPEIKIVKEQVKVEVQDNTRINALELELQQVKLQLNAEQDKVRTRDNEIQILKQNMMRLEQAKNVEIERLLAKIRELEGKIPVLKADIENLEELLRQKQLELEEWQTKYSELQNSSVSVTEEKVTYLSNEIEVWKQRFIQLNRDFHVTQEELIMAQAELDSIKKGGTKEVKEVTVTKTTSSGLSSSGILSSSSSKATIQVSPPPP